MVECSASCAYVVFNITYQRGIGFLDNANALYSAKANARNPCPPKADLLWVEGVFANV